MLFDSNPYQSDRGQRYGRVRGKHNFARNAGHGAIECDAFFIHSRVNGFEHGKSAVPFIQMQNAGRDAHGLQRAETANPQQQFLPVRVRASPP